MTFCSLMVVPLRTFRTAKLGTFGPSLIVTLTGVVEVVLITVLRIIA